MKEIVPYIFWPWFTISCGILLHRRFSGGSWRAQPRVAETDPVEFPPAATMAPPPPPPPPPPSPSPDGAAPESAAPQSAPVAVLAETDRVAARTLAEALDGIEMPCDLSPLMGDGTIDPRKVNFFASGVAAATVGTALSDELERLGFRITPEDERSIRAERGPDLVHATLVSAELTSDAVMAEHHPSAPEGAIVVELKLA